MAEGPPKVADPPHSVDVEPDVLVARLRERLVSVRSVWFPTPRELRAWRDAGVPLYIRRLGPDRFEVGPRLESLWAACFAPVLEGTTHARQGGTDLRWRRRWPRFTLGLLSAWWVVLIAWPPLLWAQIVAGEDHAGWIPFWGVLALSSTAGAAVGWIMGGRALDAAIPWLHAALVQPDVDEDW